MSSPNSNAVIKTFNIIKIYNKQRVQGLRLEPLGPPLNYEWLVRLVDWMSAVTDDVQPTQTNVPRTLVVAIVSLEFHKGTPFSRQKI
jgi:hypothetical protein